MLWRSRYYPTTMQHTNTHSLIDPLFRNFSYTLSIKILFGSNNTSFIIGATIWSFLSETSRLILLSLREKCRIQSYSGLHFRGIGLNIQENAELNNSEYGHVSRSIYHLDQYWPLLSHPPHMGSLPEGSFFLVTYQHHPRQSRHWRTNKLFPCMVFECRHNIWN